MELLKSPTYANCRRKSSYISDREELKILKGEIQIIKVYDQLEDRTYTLNASECIKALLDKVHESSYGGGTYRCFNYGLLSEAQEPVLETQAEAQVPVQPQYMTREDVAVAFGVDPVRISELHNFEFLVATARIGNRLFYLPSDVQKCLNESRVQTWIKNVNSK